MSTISASTTTTNAYVVTADTTGTLVLQTGATPTTAVTIDGSQNVGIGTSSPTNRLSFGANIGRYFALYEGTAGADLYGIGTETSALTFKTAAAERMRINSAGAVGIGTTSPGTLGIFEVQATSGNMTGLAVKNNATGNVLYGGSYTNISMASESASFQITQVGGSGFLYGGAASVNFVQSSNAPMTFLTNGAERMRIDSSGNLLVGTTSKTSPNPGISAYMEGVSNSQFVIGHSAASGSGQGYVSFLFSGGAIGSISQNGTTAVAYNTTSDYRLKTNVQPLAGALSRIADLKPCTYTWKSAPDEIGEGFIAHELAEVCPQAVTGEKDAVNEDGSIKPQSIDTSFLVATLTAAIQEQQAIIETLTERIAVLENK